MFDPEIKKTVSQMKFLLSAMRTEKPKKPLHGNRKVNKKYRDIHEDYLKTIEQLNLNREASILSFKIIINCIEYILKTPDQTLKIKKVSDRLKKQRSINKKIHEAFKELSQITAIIDKD